MTLGSATSFSYNISFIGMHPNNFKQTVKLGRCQTYKDKRIFFSLGNRKRLIKKKQKVFVHSWDDLSAGKTHYIHSTESSAGPSIPPQHISKCPCPISVPQQGEGWGSLHPILSLLLAPSHGTKSRRLRCTPGVVCWRGESLLDET